MHNLLGMFGRKTKAIGSGLLLAAGIAGTGCLDPSSPADTTASPGASGAGAPERGCAERVESQTIKPKRGRDTVIGPVAFYRLKAGFRPDAQLKQGAPRFVPIKALALVNSGARVKLVVPSSQRAWMRLFYTGESAYGGGPGTTTVTLKACRRVRFRRTQRRECKTRPYRACRAPNTQFNGEIGLDYPNAPRQGRCATLTVRHTNARTSTRQRLFDPAPGTCP